MLDIGFIREIERLRGENTPFCAATIVDGRGSIPQVIGASALFTRGGLQYGTVGGGAIEARCAEIAAELLDGDDAAPTRFERLRLNDDVGMACAGDVSLYFEIFRPDRHWSVVVFGAGHVAQKLCRFLAELDCHVVCVDTRAEWLDRMPRAANVERCLVDAYSDGAARVGDGAMVVVMTMGHAADIDIVEAIAAKGPALRYLGVIGSASKAAVLRRELAGRGVDSGFIGRIVCPVGDKVGNNTPGEIAVGIVAQLMRHREAAAAPAEETP